VPKYPQIIVAAAALIQERKTGRFIFIAVFWVVRA
jgi:hypothetical protein